MKIKVAFNKSFENIKNGLKNFDKKIFNFNFFIVKHFNYNIVNCIYWDSNSGPVPSLYLAFFKR